jgi:hypothetical protein
VIFSPIAVFALAEFEAQFINLFFNTTNSVNCIPTSHTLLHTDKNKCEKDSPANIAGKN